MMETKQLQVVEQQAATMALVGEQLDIEHVIARQCVHVGPGGGGRA